MFRMFTYQDTVRGQRAYGVSLNRDEGAQKIRARKEIILSAAAVAVTSCFTDVGSGRQRATTTPTCKPITVRSFIIMPFPIVHIDVKMDLPGVGRNSQDHLAVQAYYYSPKFGRHHSMSDAQVNIDEILNMDATYNLFRFEKHFPQYIVSKDIILNNHPGTGLGIAHLRSVINQNHIRFEIKANLFFYL